MLILFSDLITGQTFTFKGDDEKFFKIGCKAAQSYKGSPFVGSQFVDIPDQYVETTGEVYRA